MSLIWEGRNYVFDLWLAEWQAKLAQISATNRTGSGIQRGVNKSDQYPRPDPITPAHVCVLVHPEGPSRRDEASPALQDSLSCRHGVQGDPSRHGVQGDPAPALSVTAAAHETPAGIQFGAERTREASEMVPFPYPSLAAAAPIHFAGESAHTFVVHSLAGSGTHSPAIHRNLNIEAFSRGLLGAVLSRAWWTLARFGAARFYF